MESFKLALFQHSSPIGAKSETLEKTAAWARKASKAGAILACFPELGLTGHAGHPAMVREAEPVPRGPCVEFLCTLAGELNLYICAGIAEDDRGIHYNTQFIVGPEGYLGKQRKVHLSRDEHYYFRGGTAVPVIELPMARAGIVICYDNLFPELSRCLAVQGAELLLCVYAARFGKWPRDAKGRRKAVEHQKQSWRLIHSCRAYDNGCYVALCNMVGQSGVPGVEASHAGVCMVFGPGGELVAESRSKDIAEEMLVVELDGGKVAERRREPCFNLQTRRPEVFSVLSQPTE